MVAVGGGAAAVHHAVSGADEANAVVREEEERPAQYLPDEFLAEIETLAVEKMAAFPADRTDFAFHTGSVSLDIPADAVSIENAHLLNDAVYCETGGTAALYLVYEGDMRISEEWADLIVNPIPTDYPDAAIAFVLDAFPLKFLREDGSIVYGEDDFDFYRLYPSRAVFDAELQEQYRYTEHEWHGILLP